MGGVAFPQEVKVKRRESEARALAATVVFIGHKLLRRAFLFGF
jgi:hypothetical protein